MADLFSESRVKEIDPMRVHSIYEDWPRLAREGFRVKLELDMKPVRKAYVLGMGGSASGGDIIAGWLSDRPGFEMAVFKGQLPLRDLGGAIVIACSASGQTEETIGMLRTAVERRAKVVAISGGGMLKEVSSELGVPHIDMPEFLAPRYVFPFILFSTLAVVNLAMGLACDGEAEDAISSMELEREDVRLKTSVPRNSAKALAKSIINRVPTIYGARVTRGVGIRFKNALNENAKMHAFFDDIPNAFHNDIEAWEDPADEFIPIFLRHPAEGERDRTRVGLMIDLLARSGRGPFQVEGRGKSNLAKLVTMAYRLDLASYYAAVGLGRNPAVTKFIDRMKESR